MVLDGVSGVFDQDFLAFLMHPYLRPHGEELNCPQVPRARHLWTMRIILIWQLWLKKALFLSQGRPSQAVWMHVGPHCLGHPASFRKTCRESFLAHKKGLLLGHQKEQPFLPIKNDLAPSNQEGNPYWSPRMISISFLATKKAFLLGNQRTSRVVWGLYGA